MNELESGIEWIVDAHGCDPARLRSEMVMGFVFGRIVLDLDLKPIGTPHFHVFPEPGGVTGMLMLSESHLTCHTFPESGYAAFNLYCCRPRPQWPWVDQLREHLGASAVQVRSARRPVRESA